jgi:HEPN domain-containing protein
VDLCQALSAPLSVLLSARDLNPSYTVARYPDAANGVPEEMYDRPQAESCLKHSKRILAWVRRLLK